MPPPASPIAAGRLRRRRTPASLCPGFPPPRCAITPLRTTPRNPSPNVRPPARRQFIRASGCASMSTRARPRLNQSAPPPRIAERTVSGLKRRLDDVLAAADAATAELDAAKRAREAAETDLRGTQVQASIAAATIQALEATISHLQDEIAKVGSELEELKSKEDSERDEFISQMVEMNARIRQFQQMASVELARKCSEVSTDGEQGKAADGNQGKGTDGHNVSDKNETAESEDMVTDLADKLSSIEAEMHALEEEYQKDLLDHKQVCQELADVQAKRALIEAVMDETKQLQEVGGRVAEMEKVLNSVAEELQRRYMCPGCGTNNMGGMEEEAARTSSN